VLYIIYLGEERGVHRRRRRGGAFWVPNASRKSNVTLLYVDSSIYKVFASKFSTVKAHIYLKVYRCGICYVMLKCYH